MSLRTIALSLAAVVCMFSYSRAEDPAIPPADLKATGPGWLVLDETDFANVNGKPDTWTWKEDGTLHCTGQPTGVLRTQEQYTNFELSIEWCHRKEAGNSGVFVWTTPASIEKLKGPGLPSGIEVQVLDHGYKTRTEKAGGKTNWFTTNGDVFAVGVKMTPFPPLSPDGSRSFPTKNMSKGINEWNHYFIRANQGEIRLWVNGEMVSGGKNCQPATGYLCLESEGSPIDFRHIKLRQLPAK